MRLIIWSAAIMVSFATCKTTSPKAVLKDAVSESFQSYETVNTEPQFADDDEHFMVYWAVWRQLSPQEYEAIATKPGAILSQRDIYWSVDDCKTGSRLHMDGETVWYNDELTKGADGLVTPIKEAPRPGHKYFVMLNLNSQHLRGAGPWVGPKKERGETAEAWDQRRHKAYLEWLKRSWAKGTKGQVNLVAEHRLYPKDSLSQTDSWISPKDYPQLKGEQLQLVTKYSPKQWPIYFDERAHKPHSFAEPASWRNGQSFISPRKFRMRLDWNWCDTEKPVNVEIFVPRGEMPPGGPNRPGRSDSGQRKIKILEWGHPTD